jgi:hypothetical protein
MFNLPLFRQARVFSFGHPRTSTNIHEHSRTFTNIHEHPRISTNIHEHPRTSTNIHEQFVSILGSAAIICFIITKYLKGTRCTADNEVILKLECLDVIDQAILAALDKDSFSSVWDLAKRTCIPSTMVWRQPTNSIGFIVKHLHWVPHKLNDTQLIAKVKISANSWESYI